MNKQQYDEWIAIQRHAHETREQAVYVAPSAWLRRRGLYHTHTCWLLDKDASALASMTLNPGLVLIRDAIAWGLLACHTCTRLDRARSA